MWLNALPQYNMRLQICKPRWTTASGAPRKLDAPLRQGRFGVKNSGARPDTRRSAARFQVGFRSHRTGSGRSYRDHQRTREGKTP
jgi:hypothetical protein